ncbi:hypothetical protein DFH06DRAFT_1210758 [Mycena polygramma]|nr:hypothetical protein DFH06DRAFT_1210758 [Mycena polygramma]
MLLVKLFTVADACVAPFISRSLICSVLASILVPIHTHEGLHCWEKFVAGIVKNILKLSIASCLGFAARTTTWLIFIHNTRLQCFARNTSITCLSRETSRNT